MRVVLQLVILLLHLIRHLLHEFSPHNRVGKQETTGTDGTTAAAEACSSAITGDGATSDCVPDSHAVTDAASSAAHVDGVAAGRTDVEPDVKC